MDISDLLSFKPETIPKRKQDDDEEGEGKSQKTAMASKRPKIDEKILELIEAANDEDDDDSEILDEIGLKKLSLVFEKRVLHNQKMRLKYPEDATRFMDSEIDLHDAIKKMQAVATVPDLYPLLVSLSVVASMLELLSHPNTDISAAIIEIIMELTDVDILHESTEGAETLIDCLQEQSITKLLVTNCLERLDESVKEESDAVHNTFSIFENLTEFRPETCVEIAEQGLMQWILKRLKVKQYDANKLYCSEVLSILLQNTNENRILLGTIDGIDVLLQQLAIYKRHDPTTDEEKEYMENLFNCLCSSLLAKENRSNFLKGEGCQLMNLMLREKKLSRNGALKVLDYACSGTDGKENCLKFVDILGLRTIFPLFMKTPKKNKQRLLSSEEFEEHVCSIISR
jgi:beta-catenin-like protein 1